MVSGFDYVNLSIALLFIGDAVRVAQTISPASAATRAFNASLTVAASPNAVYRLLSPDR